MFKPRMYLPDYNTARSSLYPVDVKPPFDFAGTITRVFPLRADLGRLQTFIDQYLNVVPEEVAEFRAFVPYVYLVFIYYGRMSLDAASLGWISQNEVLFSVPLLWYRKVGDRLVFHDYAFTSPFIYVDNDHSMTTGREVYGWQKDRVSAEELATSWLRTPEASRVVARFNAMVFSDVYAGQRLVSQPLLEVLQTEGSSFSRLPFDPRAAWLPWMGLPRAIDSSVDLLRDYAEVMRGVGFIREQPGAGPDAYLRMSATAMRSLRPYSSRLLANTINLKQFRDAEDPHLPAYQALTNARMEYLRIHRGGLLGDTHLLRGDTSGGFRIDMHHYATHPVVELLGLKTAEERTIAGRTVHSLRPVFPLWHEADLRYNLGENIAWRTKGKEWSDGNRRALSARPRTNDSRYNSARGAAELEVAGPFDFQNATLRVMPLLADEGKLQKFLNDCLGAPLEELDPEIARELLPVDDEVLPDTDELKASGLTIQAWGRYVYLVVTSYQQMSSGANDLGWWADRELTFYVPAVLKVDGRVSKIVLAPAYTYANNAIAALTSAEVNGAPAIKATLQSPNATWMDYQGPSTWAKQELLTASCMVLPAVGVGQQATERVFLEVFAGAPVPNEDAARWHGIADGWGRALRKELKDRPHQFDNLNEDTSFITASAHALQLLTQQRRFHILTLKQFRDTEQPSKACYQAVVEIDRQITQVHRIKEIENGLYVRIWRYPTHPIVEQLGLVPMLEEVKDGMLTHVLDPVRPFWMTVSLKEHLGKNLFVRSGSSRWEAGSARSLEPAVPPEELADSVAVAWGLRRELDPRNVNSLSTPEPIFFRERPEEALEFVDEMNLFVRTLQDVVDRTRPQWIIERILSEEWMLQEDSRWLAAMEKLKKVAQDARDGELFEKADLAEFKALSKRLEIYRGPDVPILNDRRERLAKLLMERLIASYLIQYGRSDRQVDKEEAARNFVQIYSDALTEPIDPPRIPALQLRPGRADVLLRLFVDKLRGVQMRAQEWNGPQSNEPRIAPTEDERLKMNLQDMVQRAKVWGNTLTAYLQERQSLEDAANHTRDELLRMMAKDWQKPYHVARRRTIANSDARARVFPVEENHWFIDVNEWYPVEALPRMLSDIQASAYVSLPWTHWVDQTRKRQKEQEVPRQAEDE